MIWTLFTYIIIIGQSVLANPYDPRGHRPITDLIGSCRERNLCCSGRDSSCSIQLINNAANSGLIGNLLSGSGTNSGPNNNNDIKECYCDSACIALGDCCPDYKDTCGVQDCVVSEWDQWSECNTTCGIGSMTRTRRIISYAMNGGKECPELNQQRACHGQHCKMEDQDEMLREMAIILQSSFSSTRHVDQETDIRSNLRLNYPKDPLKEKVYEYCVQFQVTKAHKTCETLGPDIYQKLLEGSTVCVHCQDAAMRRHLGYRCYGHGIKGKVTRWSMFNYNGCHGRWIKMEEQPVLSDGRCFCQNQTLLFNNNNNNANNNGDFIFV